MSASNNAGYAIGDFIGGVMDNHRRANEQRQVAEVIGGWQERSDNLEAAARRHADFAIKTFAVSVAAIEALHQLDPDHPIAQNYNDLQIKIQEVGLRAYVAGGRARLSDVENAVRAFELPVRPESASSPIVLLTEACERIARRDEKLREAAGLNTGLQTRIAALQRDVDSLKLQLEQQASDAAAVTHELELTTGHALRNIEKFHADLKDHRCERAGYREALRELSPDHPLLASRDLRDRMRRAGELAFTFNQGDSDPDVKWRALDAAAAAFVLEEVPPAAPRPAEEDFLRDLAQADGATAHFKQMAGEIEEDLKDHRAHRTVFRRELERLHPNHPLATDAALREAIARVGGMAFTLAERGHKWEALDAAAQDHFVRHAPSYEALTAINARMGVEGPFADPLDPTVDEASHEAPESGPEAEAGEHEHAADEAPGAEALLEDDPEVFCEQLGMRQASVESKSESDDARSDLE